VIVATILLIALAAAGAALATWGLCTLADDPPTHCEGCRCDLPGHHYARAPTQLYDYEQDPAYQHPTAN
jgi:hypothetical protein